MRLRLMNRSHVADWAFLALVALPLPGCESADRGAQSYRTVSAAELDGVIRQNRGKVVLVDFWAFWCEPCKRLFPHSIALQQRFGPQGLTVLTVSLDNASTASQARSFLQEHPGAAENFRLKGLCVEYAVIHRCPGDRPPFAPTPK